MSFFPKNRNKRVPLVSQIDLFKNYTYLIRPCAKKKKKKNLEKQQRKFSALK